jgi:glutathione S-transferase
MTSMRSAITLYTAPFSMFGMKVEIALREKDLAFERVSVPYNAIDGYHPKHPDVVRINPKRQVPVLVRDDVELFDSTQIFEYLEDLAPEPPLWPRGIGKRAHARQLEHKSDEVYFPHIIRLMGLQSDLTSAFAIGAIDGARTYYAEMEMLLGDRQFCVDTFTYADIAFYMAQLFGERMGAPLTADLPRLVDWRARITQRPAVRRTLAPLVEFLRALRRPIPAHLA